MQNQGNTEYIPAPEELTILFNKRAGLYGIRVAEHRLTAVAIDWIHGTTAGYISKDIDGFGLNADLYGRDPRASAIQVDAWASTRG
jgi:hypothetical protein